jgi:hypothetical protein
MIGDYHPHTVRDSMVPLYMRGWQLGQDTIDPIIYDPGGDLVPPSEFTPLVLAPSGADLNLQPTIYDPTTGLIAPVPASTPGLQLAPMYQSAVAAGTMTPAQAAAALAQNSGGTLTLAQATAALAQVASGVTSVVKAAATGLSTAPSPRVAVPAVPGAATSLLNSQSIIKGVPDLAILGIAALALFGMSRN